MQVFVQGALKLTGVRLETTADTAVAHEEIRGAVEFHHSGGLVGNADRRMLGGVLDLADMDVSQVMVHRKSIVMLDADESPRELVAHALEAPYTRLPLYRDDPENIIGVLHAKDLLRAVATSPGGMDAIDVVAVAREPWFIPETTVLKDQLTAFLRRRSHFALVVDEYGALRGLVTLEDIIEEIVGEIEDEHDLVAHGVRRQPDGSVAVDGSVAIRDLNRAMDWDLPEDDAVTVAGLIIDGKPSPTPAGTFTFHGHRFQVCAGKIRSPPPSGSRPPIEDEADPDD